MSEIALRQDDLPGTPEPTSMLEMIYRAARDPSVDADKMERLLAMAERIEARGAKAAYTAALIAMKPELPVIERSGLIVIHEKGKPRIEANIIQSTPYALWEDIDEAITPVLAKHGFVLTFRTGSAADGKITVTGVLMHEKGHSEEATMPLPLDTSGSKNNVQAAGSSISYGKRYTSIALLNIRTKGADDDGQEGGGEPLDSEPQENSDVTEGVKNWIDKQKVILDAATRLPDLLMWLDENGGEWKKPLSGSSLDRLKRKAPPAFSNLRGHYQAKLEAMSRL